MAYSPLLGGRVGASFPLQFPKARISSISMSATPVFQLANDGTDNFVGHGSGFFWNHNGRIFLLSARHVLSGLDPFENKPMSTSGYIPRRVAVFPSVQKTANEWSRIPAILEIDQSSATPWLEDPEFELLRTDIAALPLVVDGPVQCLNDSTDIFEEILSHIGFECSVVGYPIANVGGLMTPIWRRGIIASEPLLPVDDKPMFLLDASTSPGFSGSPVFRLHIGPLPVDSETGLKVLLDRVVTTTLVGVYAGRLQHSHFGGEVPFVFYANRIPSILSQAV